MATAARRAMSSASGTSSAMYRRPDPAETREIAPSVRSRAGIGVRGGHAADLAVVADQVHHAEIREGGHQQTREPLERRLVVQRRGEQTAGFRKQGRALARRFHPRQKDLALGLDLATAPGGV